MFRPNSIGLLRRANGYDVHAREVFYPAIVCPFAPVSLARSAVRTTVRADSSASRGAADETVADARVLIVNYLKPSIGDRFEFAGLPYKIRSVHPRHAVSGKIDHYDCELDALPQ